MKKKLIFLFDGTGNAPEDASENSERLPTNITNIVKLHMFLGGNFNDHSSTIPEHETFYYPGVATGGDKLQNILAFIFPKNAHDDAKRIVNKAARDLDDYLAKQNNTDEFEIYVFGFSRGAAIARWFADGKIKKGFVVKFLGVFDTVAFMDGSSSLDKDELP